MITNRKAAMIIGIYFIAAAILSIIGLILYTPILQNANYMTQGPTSTPQIVSGALLELFTAATVAGTAIGFFPYLRKRNEGLALGYVCFRLLEAILIVIGLLSMLSILTLRQQYVGLAAPDAAAFQAAAHVLLAIHAWTFTLGPAFVLGINTLMCSTLLWQTRYVPRLIAIMGMIGAVVIFAASILEMFGIMAQISLWGALVAIPITLYEMSLAVWLIVKGFNTAAIAAEAARATNS